MNQFLVTLIVGLPLLVANGCGRDARSPTASKEAPESLANGSGSRDSPNDHKVATEENAKPKITSADAVRIAVERFRLNGKPEPGATAQLKSFRECYQRAWDNIHGDPNLRGPVAFGDLENLDRDGQCWSVEARYGNWLAIAYIDENGDVIYSFNR